eukprot:gene9230-9395_t
MTIPETEVVRARMRRRKDKIVAGNVKAVQVHKSARDCADMFIEFTLRRESSIALAKRHGLGEKWGAVLELEQSLSKLKKQCERLQTCFFDRPVSDASSKATDQHGKGPTACDSSSTLALEGGHADAIEPAAASNVKPAARPLLPPPPPPLPPPSKAPAATAVAAAVTGTAAAATSRGAESAERSASSSRSDTPQQQRPSASSPGPNTPTTAATPPGAAAADANSPALVVAGDAGGRLKTLHVDPVPVHKVAEGSFWKVAHPVPSTIQDSMEYLLRQMFSDKPPRRLPELSPRSGSAGPDGDSGSQADGAGQLSLVTCVPEKRALQVEVVLKRLRMQPEVLADAINQLNTHKLKADDLAALRSILPKAEEISQVRQAKQVVIKAMAAAGGVAGAATADSSDCQKDVHGRPLGSDAGSILCQRRRSSSSSGGGGGLPMSPRLGVVEACFDALGNVDMLPAKIRAMEFRYDVDSVAAVVADYTADLGRSLDALRVSGSLHYLLAFVRDVANTMNRAGPRGPLAGFKLESLARLQSTKMAGATDLNLLHYIVAHLSAVLPGVLVLDAEREAFKSACRRGTFDSVFARVRTLQDLHKRLTADLSRAREAQRQQQQKQGKQQVAEDLNFAQVPELGVNSTCDVQQDHLLPAPVSNTQAPETPSGGGFAVGDASPSHDVYMERLTQLLEATGPRVAELQQQLEDAMTKFKWTAEYYCEDVDRHTWKQQPVAFLTHFLDLLDGLVATQKDTARVARVTAMLSQYVELQQLQQALDDQQETAAGGEEVGEADAGDVGTAASGVSGGELAGGDDANAAVAAVELLDAQSLSPPPPQQLPAKPQVPLLALAKAQRHLEPATSAAGRPGCSGRDRETAAAAPSSTRSWVHCEGVGCSRARKAALAGFSNPSTSSSLTSSCAADAGIADSLRRMKPAAGRDDIPHSPAALASHKLAPGHCAAARAPDRSSGSATGMHAAQQRASGGSGKAVNAPQAAGAGKAVRPQQRRLQASQPLVTSDGVGPGQRTRSVSPLRPSPSGKPAPLFLSPVKPSMHQQHRLDALRLRSKHSPQQQVADVERADELPVPSSPAAAVLMGLESVAKSASAQLNTPYVSSGQQGTQQEASKTTTAQISDSLARLLFDSLDSTDFEQLSAEASLTGGTEEL